MLIKVKEKTKQHGFSKKKSLSIKKTKPSGKNGHNCCRLVFHFLDLYFPCLKEGDYIDCKLAFISSRQTSQSSHCTD